MRALVLLLVAFTASAAHAAPPATHWAAVDRYAGFRGWRDELQHMADQDGRFPASHFCVVVTTGSTAAPAGSFTWAYVYWREAARLYTFGQSDEAMSDLTAFKEPLDLGKDVAATARGLHGSTSRVTRAWIGNVLRHCAKAGTNVIVRQAA